MKTERIHFLVLSGVLLAISLLPSVGNADVSVNVGVFAPPPPYVIPAPPSVVVIPKTYVYMVPDIGFDIFFYHGSWYRPFDGRWYKSRSYNGPWTYLASPRVPRPLLTLPPHYRNVPPGHQRVPYGQAKKNWSRWERERHWDKDKDWHEGWQARPEGHGGDIRGPGKDERHEDVDRRHGPDHGRGADGHGR
jgi:hypothetical protein